MIQSFFITILGSLFSVIHDLGWSIVAMTILIRTILLPITLPSLKASKKIQDLKPELDSLKKRFANDKQGLNQAQMELYKKYNVNPLSGCIPQILQLVILIGLYRALQVFLQTKEINGLLVSPVFAWFDLTAPDSSYILPVIAGLTQLVLALMISPGGEVKDLVPNQSKKKKVVAANKKEEDSAEMAKMMQQQMIFMMPLMTGLVAAKFPSGMALYWITTNIFSLIQQAFISGPGGLKIYSLRLINWINKKMGKSV